MKDEKKRAKALLQEQSLPYATWTGNLAIPIAMIVIFIIGLLGYGMSFYSIVILVATIQVHRFNAKLKLGNRSYIAPIMVYLYNVLSIPMAILLLHLDNGELLPLLLIELLFVATVVTAIVFFFITASQIKKQFPTLKADRQAALQVYKETLANLMK
ncbi:hypothetical protein [Pseudolactococcus reticulitermitis]|uniref:Uncharacterized protein n=1 Tax=Pseudolactococcus reticulitermitis TaxID=2025039 RepID=A0A224WWY4_9LACT|nr:hypothetical protein [Lactococcus reticulitermitis]GAX46818.1 hypothetical protein RsY01_398 [Lactococcus reticulitermitis]